MKYELAEYLMKKDNDNEWYISANMLTYDCPYPAAPKKQADGFLMSASEEDYEAVKEFMRCFLNTTSEKGVTDKECEDMTKHCIASGNLLLWINCTGKVAAMCYIDYGTELGKVTHVYTVPEERRKGYAARIVYEASCRIKEKGLMPILYTDGDYNASNECYKGVGYIERSCLCSVSRK
jgi:predicted GNAT family acetyltransferase